MVQRHQRLRLHRARRGRQGRLRPHQARSSARASPASPTTRRSATTSPPVATAAKARKTSHCFKAVARRAGPTCAPNPTLRLIRQRRTFRRGRATPRTIQTLARSRDSDCPWGGASTGRTAALNGIQATFSAGPSNQRPQSASPPGRAGAGTASQICPPWAQSRHQSNHSNLRYFDQIITMSSLRKRVADRANGHTVTRRTPRYHWNPTPQILGH